MSRKQAERFWRGVEDVGGLCSTRAGWEALCGKTGYGLVKDLLEGTAERANWYPAPGRSFRMLDVKPMPDGDGFVAFSNDPDYLGGDLKLTKSDVAVRRLPIRALAALVAGPLGFRAVSRAKEITPYAVRLGPLHSHGLTVYLIVPSSAEDFSLAFGAIRRQDGSLLAIITPTSRFLPADFRQLEMAESTTTLPTVGKIAGSRKISGIAGISNLIGILADAGLNSEWLPDFAELEEDASERDASGTESIPSASVHYVAVTGADRPWVGRQFAALDDLGTGSVTGYELGTYNAQAGTFTPNTTANQNSGTDVRSFTVELRGSGLPAALEGTLRIAVEDAKGHPLREELYVLDESESWSSSPATVATYEYPEFWPDGLVREVIRYHDGRVVSHARQVSGTETVTWDEQGSETRTYTDTLGRVTANIVVGHGTQPDRVTSYQHAGRTT